MTEQNYLRFVWAWDRSGQLRTILVKEKNDTLLGWNDTLRSLLIFVHGSFLGGKKKKRNTVSTTQLIKNEASGCPPTLNL